MSSLHEHGFFRGGGGVLAKSGAIGVVATETCQENLE